MKIGIKYCGDCNPEIDSTRIVQRLQEKLKGKDVEFVFDLSTSFCIPLLLCGCPMGCLDREEVTGPLTGWIAVKGKTFEVHAFPENSKRREALLSLMVREIQSWMEEACFI
jgi:hypothetical protein